MSEQTLGHITLALFAVVVVADILWAYYGWVRMPPLQSLFVRVWLAAVALLVPMGTVALVSGRLNIISTMAVFALAGLLLLAGPLLTPWPERRPAVIAMNILSSLISFFMIFFVGFMTHVSANLFVGSAIVSLRGLALMVTFLIVTPICMVGSTRLARQQGRSAIYVAYIPVALAPIATAISESSRW
jgi:hypothetical protein